MLFIAEFEEPQVSCESEHSTVRNFGQTIAPHSVLQRCVSNHSTFDWDGCFSSELEESRFSCVLRSFDRRVADRRNIPADSGAGAVMLKVPSPQYLCSLSVCP
ncbi:hypothetical protein BaRGS_00016443 [Batillaria attramentaria]|uniref:Uncharacterized protein n=1 Tax=Batillaria attramentaria TaxID=370345 RepID=A0ABD0KZ28_9CAEN